MILITLLVPRNIISSVFNFLRGAGGGDLRPAHKVYSVMKKCFDAHLECAVDSHFADFVHREHLQGDLLVSCNKNNWVIMLGSPRTHLK